MSSLSAVAVEPQSSVTALGFWLPCGPATFIRQDSDADLLGKDYDLTSRAWQDWRTHGDSRLDISVLRRLTAVLPHKGFQSFIPLYRLLHNGESQLPTSTFPSAAAFLCRNLSGLPEQDWRSTLDQSVDLFVLLVTDEGFYLLLAVTKGNRPAKDQASADAALLSALRSYISWLVGGSYFSHYSGPVESDGGYLVEGYERAPSLQHYRDQFLGILNFTQLNTILEGLFNSNLDPHVFFHDLYHATQVEIIKKRHSLGGFAELITVQASFGQDDERRASAESLANQALQVSAVVQSSFSHPNLLDEATLQAERLLGMSMTSAVQRQVLDQFMHGTFSSTLVPIKSDVDRCRRALLKNMLDVTHQLEPILQTEATDDDTSEVFAAATDSQLQGYVALLASKAPLIADTEGHLGETIASVTDDIERAVLSDLFRTWQLLSRAISDGIVELERTVDQMRNEQVRAQEEQVRDNQETLAKIQQLRERVATAIPPAQRLTIDVVSALVTIVLAIVTIYQTGIRQFITASATGRAIDTPTILLIWVAGLIILFAVFRFVVEIVSASVRGIRPNVGRYFYGAVARLDVPLLPEHAWALFNAQWPSQKSSSPRFESGSATSGTFATGRSPLITHPKLSEYEIERPGADESLHELLFQTTIRWSKPRGMFRRARAEAFLSYDVLYHRLARSTRFVLISLRVVIVSRTELSTKEIQTLEMLIIERFINPWISDRAFALRADSGSKFALDSLLALCALTSKPGPFEKGGR